MIRTVASKQQERETLASDVAAFIAGGGVIEEVEGFRETILSEARHPEPVREDFTHAEQIVFNAYKSGIFSVDEIRKSGRISRTAVQKARDSLVGRGFIIKIMRGRYKLAERGKQSC